MLACGSQTATRNGSVVRVFSKRLSRKRMILLNLCTELRESYLDYVMSVLIGKYDSVREDRALGLIAKGTIARKRYSVALSNSWIETFRHPNKWSCPKYCLASLLYQNARAPPFFENTLGH
jgi:hypothetical protein